MHIFSALRSWRRREPSETLPLGRILPYDGVLDPVAEKYCCCRLQGGTESTASLARRAGLAICEAIELKHRELEELEEDLRVVMAHDPSATLSRTTKENP
jgi:hypothetical protein